MIETVRGWLTANWFQLLIAAYLIGMMLYGHDRGFLKLAVSMIALILTIALVNMALPHVSSFIKTHTGIENSIKESLLKSVGVDEIDDGQTVTQTAQQQAIEKLKIPENLKSVLEKNNTNEIWNILGVDKFKEYVAGYLSNLIINYIGFAVLFVIIWFLLHMFIRFADIFTRLPVLHGLNQIAGAVLGLLEGLIFMWIGFMFLSACSGTETGGKLMAMVSQSKWVTYLFNSNMVSYFFKDIINTMF